MLQLSSLASLVGKQGRVTRLFVAKETKKKFTLIPVASGGSSLRLSVTGDVLLADFQLENDHGVITALRRRPHLLYQKR